MPSPNGNSTRAIDLRFLEGPRSRWEEFRTVLSIAGEFIYGFRKLHFLGDAAVLRVSALTGRGVHRLLPALDEAISQYQTRVPTRKVNDPVRRAQQAQPAPHGARILYATQGATDPPTFTLFTNKDVPASYLRYIERQIQNEFGLGSTPVKLRVRRRAD